MDIQGIIIDEIVTDYDSLDNEQVIKVVFGYVQTGLDIPKELQTVCESRSIWEIVEPLIGENDVESIMDEIEEGIC